MLHGIAAWITFPTPVAKAHVTAVFAANGLSLPARIVCGPDRFRNFPFRCHPLFPIKPLNIATGRHKLTHTASQHDNNVSPYGLCAWRQPAPIKRHRERENIDVTMGLVLTVYGWALIVG